MKQDSQAGHQMSCLSARLFASQLPTFPFIGLFRRLSVRLSVCLSVCLSVGLLAMVPYTPVCFQQNCLAKQARLKFAVEENC